MKFDSLQITALLISYGANVNASGRDGQTALHWATMQGHYGVCYVLIEGGADIDAKDDFGFSPLLRAVQQNEMMVVQLLVTRGCSMTETDHEGHTALHWASHLGRLDVAVVLLRQTARHGANHDAAAMARLHAPDEDGSTPLHLAAKGGNWPLMAALLEHGGNAASVNFQRELPETIAAASGHPKCARALVWHSKCILGCFRDGSPFLLL